MLFLLNFALRLPTLANFFHGMSTFSSSRISYKSMVSCLTSPLLRLCLMILGFGFSPPCPLCSPLSGGPHFGRRLATPPFSLSLSAPQRKYPILRVSLPLNGMRCFFFDTSPMETRDHARPNSHPPWPYPFRSLRFSSLIAGPWDRLNRAFFSFSPPLSSRVNFAFPEVPSPWLLSTRPLVYRGSEDPFSVL